MAALPLRITFVTGNAKKLEEVTAILGTQHASRFVLDSVSLDLPELQGHPEDVAKEKARLASERCGGKPVLVEDTSLCFVALNGLPGVYIKWFLEAVGHDGLNRMLEGFPDKRAYAQCVFAYAPGNGEVLTFVGRTEGHIVPARGENQFGWDPVFAPSDAEADGHTYATMSKETKNLISHRYRALDKFRTYLLGVTGGEAA